jgi:spermidine/putrescine transport system ATP-binding protein
VTAPAVEIIDLAKRFGDHLVLDGVNLAVEPGEFVSLLGPSGCGKTTLLRIVAGFEQPTHGRVRVRGVDVTAIPPHRRPTNIVFQRGALFPHMDVFDNIAYSLKLRRWPKARIAERVEELLALVRLEGLARRGPTELSGGQIQRVALARALAAEPTVLLLDEPLSALDLKLRQHMQLELRSIQRKLGATFIYVTHDQTEAMVMSDRIAVMNEGRIVQLGTPKEIYARPASVFVSDFIGETNLVDAIVVEARADGLVALQLGATSRIVGRSAERLAVGERATLSVRPEAVRARLSRAMAGPTQGLADMATTCIEGRVIEVMYLGNRTRLEVELHGGATVLVDLRDSDGIELERGVIVELGWDAQDASVWRAGGAPRVP